MFDPREHLVLATRLLSESSDEATRRLAINRAYYAAFLVAREFIDRKGSAQKPPRGRRWGSHERVIFSVGVIPNPSARGIRKALFRLKRLRTSADYDLEYNGASVDIGRAVRDARRIITWIDALP